MTVLACALRASSLALAGLTSPALFGPTAAHAQERLAGAVLVDAGELQAIDPALEDTLRELLARVGLELVFTGSSSGPPVIAHVQLETMASTVVVSVQSATDGAATRRSVPRATSAPLFRETLAHIVLGAVEPLAREARVAEDNEPAARVLPEPEAVPAEAVTSHPTRFTELWLGMQAGPVAFGSDQLTAAFGAALGVRFDVRMRPSLALEGGAVWPRSIDARSAATDRDGTRAGMDARFSCGSARLSALLELASGARLGLDAGLAAGVDMVAFEVRDAPASAVRAPRSRRVQPVVGPRLVARWRLGSSLETALSAGVDIDGAPRRWVDEAGAERVTLLSLWRARPYGYLRLSWIGRRREESAP